MATEFWVLVATICLIGVFSDWRVKYLLKRIQELEQRETEMAKEAAREESRDIIVGIFADPMPEDHRNYKHHERAKRSLHEYMARVARDSIDPRVIRRVEELFEGSVQTGVSRIEIKTHKAISSIPDLKDLVSEAIRNTNGKIAEEGINYRELEARINSPEFIQDVISRIRVLQLCGTGEVNKKGE